MSSPAVRGDSENVEEAVRIQRPPASSGVPSPNPQATRGGSRRDYGDNVSTGGVAVVFLATNQGSAVHSGTARREDSNRHVTANHSQQIPRPNHRSSNVSSTQERKQRESSRVGSSGALHRGEEVQAILSEVEAVGQTMGRSKLKYSWVVDVCGAMCEVVLFHSKVSGKKKLFQNGVLIRQDLVAKAYQFSHVWGVRGHSLSVVFRHDDHFHLTINGLPFSFYYRGNEARRVTRPHPSESPLSQPARKRCDDNGGSSCKVESSKSVSQNRGTSRGDSLGVRRVREHQESPAVVSSRGAQPGAEPDSALPATAGTPPVAQDRDHLRLESDDKGKRSKGRTLGHERAEFQRSGVAPVVSKSGVAGDAGQTMNSRRTSSHDDSPRQRHDKNDVSTQRARSSKDQQPTLITTTGAIALAEKRAVGEERLTGGRRQERMGAAPGEGSLSDTMEDGVAKGEGRIACETSPPPVSGLEKPYSTSSSSAPQDGSVVDLIDLWSDDEITDGRGSLGQSWSKSQTAKEAGSISESWSGPSPKAFSSPNFGIATSAGCQTFEASSMSYPSILTALSDAFPASTQLEGPEAMGGQPENAKEKCRANDVQPQDYCAQLPSETVTDSSLLAWLSQSPNSCPSSSSPRPGCMISSTSVDTNRLPQPSLLSTRETTALSGGAAEVITTQQQPDSTPVLSARDSACFVSRPGAFPSKVTGGFHEAPEGGHEIPTTTESVENTPLPVFPTQMGVGGQNSNDDAQESRQDSENFVQQQGRRRSGREEKDTEESGLQCDMLQIPKQPQNHRNEDIDGADGKKGDQSGWGSHELLYDDPFSSPRPAFQPSHPEPMDDWIILDGRQASINEAEGRAPSRSGVSE